jgi:23S rRNA (cytidine1920-2'-O)/16S rRNA (cytidine1409-2'-O)-methyltransferase
MQTVLKVLEEQGYLKKDLKILLMAGKIKYKNETVTNLEDKIKDPESLTVIKSKKYVSRGAYKLLQAFKSFNLNIKNKVCLDVGSSTGGFTQVMLEQGAKLVYALDVGYNQLDFSLRSNPNVLSLEKTNLKTITKDMFKEKVEFVTIDVSFISLTTAFIVLKELLTKGIRVVTLIKPQFEANSNDVELGGYVKECYHPQIIDKIIKSAKENNFKHISHVPSPIKGLKAKNVEYVALFEKE